MENKDFFAVKILNEGLINLGVQNRPFTRQEVSPTPTPALGGSKAGVRKLHWPFQTFPPMITAMWAPSSQALVGEVHLVNKH